MDVNPEEVHAHRTYLMRIAMRQLRHRDAAEDVVRQTLLAAVEAHDSVAGRSSVKTWLTGILRDKIVDAIRSKAREPAVAGQASARAGAAARPDADAHTDADAHADADADPDADADAGLRELDAFFNARDHDRWETKPAEWRNPERDFEQREFIAMLDFCLDKLPPNTARVFMLREVMELTSEEICQELKIAPANLCVILYRARMRLRHCLEQNWFAGAAL